MEEISTVGINIAKSVFQVHGIDAAGEVVVRRQLKRRQSQAAWLHPSSVAGEADGAPIGQALDQANSVISNWTGRPVFF